MNRGLRHPPRGSRRPRRVIDSRRRFPVRALLAAVALVLGGSACAVPDGPRPLPAPSLADPSSPFRDADTSSGEPAEGFDASGGGFEARLRQRLDGAGADERPPTEAQQSVRIGSGLEGRLPQRGDDWSWARDGAVVLAVHAPAGGTPDALVFAQPFDATADRRPAVELDQFLLAVEPGLASHWIGLGTEIAAPAIAAAAGLGLDPPGTLLAARMLLTPTLGRGLGYGHERASFSGWRWIGRNGTGSFLRLARTRGVWGGERPLRDELTALLDHLASQSPDLAPLLWQEPKPVPESRALMVFGSATAPSGAGAHLAILCRLLPDCPVADELGRFLDSLAPPGATEPFDARRVPDRRDLDALASRAGLLLQGEDRIGAADLADLLRSAAPASGGDTAAAPDDPVAPELEPGPATAPGVPVETAP